MTSRSMPSWAATRVAACTGSATSRPGPTCEHELAMLPLVCTARSTPPAITPLSQRRTSLQFQRRQSNLTGLKQMPHQGSPLSTNPTKMPGLPWSYTPSIQSDWPWPRSPEERKTAHQEQHNGKPVRRHAKGMGRSLTALWQNDAVSQQHVWITYLKK